MQGWREGSKVAEGMTSPDNEQLKSALDWVEKEHHKIVLLYRAE